MPTHGAASTLTVLQWDENRLAPAGSAHPPLSGFRHFMGALGPSKAEQFTLYGIPFDPSDAYAWSQADALMAKLACVMEQEPFPGGFDQNGIENAANPRIPSGYSYFMQLVAHDLVHSSIFLSRNKGQMAGLANERRLPLRLQTLYGGGPTECPHAYEYDVGFRNRLRLGSIRKNGATGVDHDSPLKDIPRGLDSGMYGQPIFPEALIADPRNDSHAIMSQLVVLFHRLHNFILEKIKRDGSIPPTGNPFVDAQRLLVAAQTASIHIYRSIVRNDLLPRILHSEVDAAYRGARVPLLNTADGLDSGSWSAPLEFTHGFFRFAHGMVRGKYHFRGTDPTDGFFIKEILLRNCEKSPELMPLEERWTVDWRHFFSDEPKPGNNFSIRIGPRSYAPLEYAVEELDPYHGGGLTFRDLVSSIATRPWSIGALVARIRSTHGELLDRSPLFRRMGCDPHERPWVKPLAEWLAQRSCHKGSRLDCHDIETLSNDPPIPFFVRFEADHEAEGKHLGILGSIVVADVLYGVFQRDPIMGVSGTEDLPDQLGALSKLILGTSDAFAGLGGLTTFQAFVSFVTMEANNDKGINH